MDNSSAPPLIPNDIDDYILIFRENCKLTNELLQMAHPDIEFVCRENNGTSYLQEQSQTTAGGLSYPEPSNINGKAQLHYCRRGQYSFTNEEHLKIYKYSEQVGFEEINFKSFANPPRFDYTRKFEFIKRSERKSYPDNIPPKPDDLKLNELDRQKYFELIKNAYLDADNDVKRMNDNNYVPSGVPMHGGGKRTKRTKRTKKRPNRKRKSTKRRRGTRKRTNKKR